LIAFLISSVFKQLGWLHLSAFQNALCLTIAWILWKGIDAAIQRFAISKRTCNDSKEKTNPKMKK